MTQLNADNCYIFTDTETSGLDINFSQIIQVGSLLTNENFVVEEEQNLSSKLFSHPPRLSCLASPIGQNGSSKMKSPRCTQRRDVIPLDGERSLPLIAASQRGCIYRMCFSLMVMINVLAPLNYTCW